MSPFRCLLLVFLSGCILFLGCDSETKSSNDSAQKQDIVLGKITLDQGWARPGSKGEKSAAYLTISNGTASSDSLLAFHSTAAQKVELHESVEHEDGTVEMQPADQQILESKKELVLEPGGLHLMLMDLKRDLATGDSLSLSLEFSRAGTKTVTVPVQIQH